MQHIWTKWNALPADLPRGAGADPARTKSLRMRVAGPPASKLRIPKFKFYILKSKIIKNELSSITLKNELISKMM